MPSNNPEVIRALSAKSPALNDLTALFPEVWDKVHAELIQLAHNPDPAQIAHALTQAHEDWQRHQKAAERLKQHYSEQLACQSAQRLIRKLSLERFVRELTQATLTSQGALRCYEKLLFRFIVLKLVMAKKARPAKIHSQVWSLFKNRGPATVALQAAGCYIIMTKEFIAALKERIGARLTLEIGAGRGLLARYLKQTGMDIVAVDDYSWENRFPMGDNVVKMDGASALQHFAPEAVISCWPPPGNNFERDIFKCASVTIYAAIISRHRFASGDWKSYAKARGWEGVESAQLKKLLLPDEAESTVLLFSRQLQK